MERILSDPSKQVSPNVTMRVARPPISGEVDEEKAALEEAAKNLPRLYASPACRRPQVPIPNGVDATEKPAVEKAVAVFGRTMKPCVPPDCVEVVRNHHDGPCPPFCTDKVAVK